MLDGFYMAAKLIGARDRENEWEMGVLPPKHRYRAHALDIGPACVMLTVEVVVVCGMSYKKPSI
jgi:hypothetical protein